MDRPKRERAFSYHVNQSEKNTRKTYLGHSKLQIPQISPCSNNSKSHGSPQFVAKARTTERRSNQRRAARTLYRAENSTQQQPIQIPESQKSCSPLARLGPPAPLAPASGAVRLRPVSMAGSREGCPLLDRRRRGAGGQNPS